MPLNVNDNWKTESEKKKTPKLDLLCEGNGLHLGRSHCIHIYIVVCGFGGAPWSMHYFYVSVRIFGIIEAQTATEPELQPRLARSFWAGPNQPTQPPGPLKPQNPGSWVLNPKHHPLSPRLLAKVNIACMQLDWTWIKFFTFSPALSSSSLFFAHRKRKDIKDIKDMGI